MDVPFYISKRTDPLRDRTIFKKRNSEAPNAASNGYITPQPTVTRPSHLLDCKGPASPWTAPAAGLASQQPAWSPHGNSASEFNRSEIARQIRANFDSLVRASPLPRAVESLIAPAAGTPGAQRQHWRAQPPTFAEAARTPLAGSGSAVAQREVDGGQQAAWRPVPSPCPPPAWQSAIGWPEASAASPTLVSSSSQLPQLQRPQPVRASPGPAHAGLLLSVLAASPAAASQMHLPRLTPASLASSEASGVVAAQASPGTPAVTLGGPAASGGPVPASRDPRLAATNSEATPAIPHLHTCSPAAQPGPSTLPRDPRLHGSERSTGAHERTEWQQTEAGSPGAVQGTAAMHLQQPEPDQPDSEVRQAVYALNLSGGEEPNRLPEALLETANACQPQERGAAGALSPFLGLHGAGEGSTAAPVGAAQAPEDGMACPGWQVEAFLNDMGSEDEAGRQATAGTCAPETHEAGAAQLQHKEDLQQNHDGQRQRLAEAVQRVEQLCSDLDGEDSASALDRCPHETAVTGCPEDARNPNEDLGGKVHLPLPVESGAPLQLSSTAASGPSLESRQDINAGQHEPSVAGDPEQTRKAVHSTSGSHRITQPAGLAGSGLPPAAPEASPAPAAASTHERSTASGQCSTLTSHTQRPQHASPVHASQEAASSPGRPPQRGARPAHTPSRFRGEAQGGVGALADVSGSAEMAGATLDKCEDLPQPSVGDEEDVAASEGDGQVQAPGLGEPAGDAEVMQLEGSAAEQPSDLATPSGGVQRRSGRRAGADVSEQKAAASTQSEEAQDGQKQSLGKKRKLASASADASKKRPAKSRADLAAKQEPNLHASTANGVSDGHLQVSRTGRVRVKPLAFWANQRLSRDALAIDQGFSDQLAQQCHSFVQQPRQRLAAPSPAKAQPGSGDKALSGSQSDPPSSKPAAPQKGGKTGDSLGKGMKRPAAEPIEAAKAHSKKSRAQDSGTTGKKPVGKEERKTAPKETKLVDSPIRPRIAVAGQQARAVKSTRCMVCCRMKRGHCGTERAVKGCLERGQGSKEPPADTVAAAPVQEKPTRAAELPTLSPDSSQGRKLGIKAQLQALSQRQHTPSATDKAVGKAKAPQKGKAGSKPSGTKGAATAHKATSGKQQSDGRAVIQGAAAGARADKGGGAVAAAKQRPGLRRLRKAADAPRDDAVELAAAARDLQDYEDEAEEVSAAQLLAQRFSPGKAEKPAAGKEAKSRKAKKRTANSGTDGQDTRSGDAHEGKSGPSGACEADVATPVRGPLDEEDDEEDADGWTRTQRDALQRAHAKEDPTGNAFWQRVAQQVPGKDAKQCFSKFWAGNPTPALACTGGPRAYLAAAAASSPLAPPARTTATGNARKLPAAATRKWARQVRWQERASQGGAACEDAAEAKGPDAKSRAGLNPCLVAAMQRAERTDKYIDAIIKKRGNPQRWQSGSMAKGSGRSHTGLVESAPADISRRPALVDSTVAAIASSAQVVPESDDESERDEYWSGDDSDS